MMEKCNISKKRENPNPNPNPIPTFLLVHVPSSANTEVWRVWRLRGMNIFP